MIFLPGFQGWAKAMFDRASMPLYHPARHVLRRGALRAEHVNASYLLNCLNTTITGDNSKKAVS
jgi:hypothetical protein